MLPQWLCGRESLNAMGVRGVCVFGDHHVVRGLKNPEGLKKTRKRSGKHPTLLYTPPPAQPRQQSRPNVYFRTF